MEKNSTGIKMLHGSRFKMQRGSICNECQDATWIKMRRGSRCMEGQEATWIKMQQGSRLNKDQNAMKKIAMRQIVKYICFKGSG